MGHTDFKGGDGGAMACGGLGNLGPTPTTGEGNKSSGGQIPSPGAQISSRLPDLKLHSPLFLGAGNQMIPNGSGGKATLPPPSQ